MMDIGKRIKQRREELGLTQDELAVKTGYKSRSSINKIERGGNDLPQTKIVTFARVLNTTPSYLLGWKDDSVVSIGEQIKKRREELGMSQAELAKAIGVTQGSVGNYETGVSNPKMELMPKIFAALQADANYFFYGSTRTQHSGVSYLELKMIKKYRALDVHGKKVVDFILNEEYKHCVAMEAAQTAEK